MARPEYTRPAQYRGDQTSWTINISTIIANLLRGRQNVVGDVTLTADGETRQTSVTDDRCHSYSSIVLDPVNDASAVLLAAGGVYIPAADRTEGAFVVTHPPVGDGTVASFYYLILG